MKQAIDRLDTVKEMASGNDFLQLIQIRQKPDAASQRLVQTISQPLSLKQKQERNLI